MRIRLIYAKRRDASLGTRDGTSAVPLQSLLPLAHVPPTEHPRQGSDEKVTSQSLDEDLDLMGILIYAPSPGSACQILRACRDEGVPVVVDSELRGKT